MDVFETVIWGVLASIIASFIFWLLTFRISRTEIAFPGIIEKSENTEEYPGQNRYRVKLINSGARDLIEVSFLVKLSIKRKYVSNYTYLGLGNANQVPLMRGRVYQKKHAGESFTNKLTLFPTQTTCNEFKKKFYVSAIREKAQDGSLSLDDILNVYGNSIAVTIYVYGNDVLTGARKMFISPTYTLENIKAGSYNVAESLNHRKYRFGGYKKYVKDSLSFSMKNDSGQSTDS